MLALAFSCSEKIVDPEMYKIIIICLYILIDF